MKTLSLAELTTILNYIDTPRDKAIISLIASTGLYINELRFLRMSDVNLTKNELKTRGNRPRHLSIHPLAKPYLSEWISLRPNLSVPYVFIALTGKKDPLSQRGIDNIIRKWSSASNIEYNYQKLRHLNKHLSLTQSSSPHLSPTPSKNITMVSSCRIQIQSPLATFLLGCCGIITLVHLLFKKGKT